MRTSKVVLFMLLACTVVLAQSSGNFAAKIATTQCEVNNETGALSGGLNGTVLNTTIKTPNASSVALNIRPSMVTGLFTRSKVTNDTSSDAAVAGVRVRVLLDGKIVAPGNPAGAFPTDGTSEGVANDGNNANDGWVYYNKRFQQLSTNIFNTLGLDCDLTTIGIADGCYIELVQSSLTANSLDWVTGDVGGGLHNVKVEWSLQPTAANADEAACVGPGVLTVTQVKTFSQSGGVEISSQN